ncbi:molybdenum cofactor biosysynthesis protein [Quadrisphaera sp. KR29]|uniref:molybdenum cofactor biosysynthesis protein n=1 Tax=Quadrisphaera sp. KR29 TaxID=3461391 RepID=UPI0040446E7E
MSEGPSPGAALEPLVHSTPVVVLHLLVSPVHRYFGRPKDGPLPFGPASGGAPAGPASEDRESADVVAGRGIVGDRFFGKAAHLDAAVTLLAVEALEAVASQLGVAPFDPLLARRNAVLRGAELEPLRGRTFALDCGEGPVLLAGRRPAAPCAWMDRQLAPGAHAALRGRGGLRCEPLGSGRLRRGSALLLSDVPLDPALAGRAVLPRGGRPLP